MSSNESKSNSQNVSLGRKFLCRHFYLPEFNHLKRKGNILRKGVYHNVSGISKNLFSSTFNVLQRYFSLKKDCVYMKKNQQLLRELSSSRSMLVLFLFATCILVYYERPTHSPDNALTYLLHLHCVCGNIAYAIVCRAVIKSKILISSHYNSHCVLFGVNFLYYISIWFDPCDGWDGKTIGHTLQRY